MAASRYEKYVVRQVVEADPKLYAPGYPPTRFLNGPEGAIKEAKATFSFKVIEKDCCSGVSEERGPHSHNFDEIFGFVSTNSKDPNDLGADVELWLGVGNETEIVRVNTSSAIYVPAGLVHLPIFFKNVRRPVVAVLYGSNVKKIKMTRYPPRGI